MDGFSALMYAAQNNHPKCVELLAQHELGIQDEDGSTALIIAAGKGNHECLPFLLAEAKMKMKSGHTALMCAAQFNHPKCVQILAQHEIGLTFDDGATALIFAAGKGND